MSNDYSKAIHTLDTADHILVSASNGLSISEGYHIFADNDAFKKYFGRLRNAYGIRNIIQGYFAPLPTAARAEFMQQLKRYMIDDYRPSRSLQDLRQLLASKDYFIVTSNSDAHFQLNGFDEQRLFEVEGNFFGRREGDDVWKGQLTRFQRFVQQISGTHTTVFELGIGARNQLIKEPLMQLVAKEPSFSYITLNMPQEIYIPTAIQSQAQALTGNIAETFRQMLAARKK